MWNQMNVGQICGQGVIPEAMAWNYWDDSYEVWAPEKWDRRVSHEVYHYREIRLALQYVAETVGHAQVDYFGFLDPVL